MWPEVRTCIEGVITYLQSCHEQSYYGDVTEKLVEYACSETNGVSNLAGMHCLKCIWEQMDLWSNLNRH